MHLRGRLNENQGTNKACNNVLWQAGYKTGQTVLHLRTACSIFLFFFQGSGKISSWSRYSVLERTFSSINYCQVTVPVYRMWSLDGNKCPLRDFLHRRINFLLCEHVHHTLKAACLLAMESVCRDAKPGWMRLKFRLNSSLIICEDWKVQKLLSLLLWRLFYFHLPHVILDMSTFIRRPTVI